MDGNPIPTFGPYTPVRTAGSLYFVSGQVGVGNDKKAAVDAAAQCAQALENIKMHLKNHNLSMSDVVKTTMFLKNMDHFAAVNDVYMDYFPDPRPARSCAAVADLPHAADNELLVEIEAVAYKDTAAND